jgi:aldehyde dehydrogenase (NAD+)
MRSVSNGSRGVHNQVINPAADYFRKCKWVHGTHACTHLESLNIQESMRVYREEIFGPVVVIASFATEDEAVEAANNTTYGLGAAVFTNDPERAHCVAAGIEAGMVWINSTQDCDPRIPFGGVKLGGIGRELGQDGLEAYPQTKAVHVNMGTEL